MLLTCVPRLDSIVQTFTAFAFQEKNLMKFDRRGFIGAGILAAVNGRAGASRTVDVERLDKAAARPVLNLDSVTSPVRIESIELLKSGRFYFVRTRSKDGAEGIAVTNSRAAYLYPILQQRVIPYFIGKDARDLESLIDGVYLYKSNYKMSNLALWCCVAWVEFSILDMLGRIGGRSIGRLLGGVVRKKVRMYYASGNRHTSPAQEVDVLKGLIARSGTKAVKFKVGGRMRNNADSIPGRSEGLIKIVRKELGDDVAIFADSNGSYDAEKGIEIGRLLEDNGIDMFEEPCPFDHLEETKKVADALSIPVAGGEQEPSQRRFRWMIENGAVQIVQPDLHYYGGYIRTTRVARMAAEAGCTVVPHMSGGGVGYVDVLHFCSYTPNIGLFHEYKGGIETTGKWYEPQLKFEDGAINVPEGPGSGIKIDPELMRNAVAVS